MQVPLEIAFHNLEPEPWAEAEIRARVDKLDRLYDRIIGCQVRVDQRANAGGATPPVVRIEITLPGRRPIVVAHEPERLKNRFQNPTLRQAIAASFNLAERQLVDVKEQIQRRGKIGAHDAENQFLGEVADLVPAEDHGFILTQEGGLLYFHRNSLLSGDFDSLRRGTPVRYVEEVGDTGPIAAKVRLKDAG
ncbi:MAG TPA: HPF/RaiA family ribosome-associated protein [Hyphomicrobiales bacterium]|nr:HPF/RaiA family ribosome-associated protein [Hyphomicrobiales bacterium]